ncbi:glycosyltransferase involved in cell wall biosynthesis [Altererythrobacter atlanticus]|uniref:Glycosyltransferase EpsJ n=1 Tax=Croceibacterium atlanticum TaxID=1267766 RepID=A0A0F7KXM7_9SPHN|nr:glycosyltransferase family A protein [Croceibacterium atlanticum]AKH43991.1 putative glycosyltransferase EpsJ [Croceibacterium atlanticum]MBB5732297.1 glycosyltransferase involved in cell wall biosynthesis [Croceibacterium atlanticum]
MELQSAPSPPPPRVAVIVPAYGVAHLVGEALDSLLAQDMTDWECVVVDDGAPDDVAEAVTPYLKDSRITFLHTDNGGVSAARNRAIAITSAPYIALLDGDDLFRPAYLARTTAALDEDPAARIVTCNARIFGALDRERYCVSAKQGTSDGLHGSLGDVLDRSFNVYIGSTFRRADFDSVGGFDETMSHAEDFDFWVRLMMLGGHALYLDEVLGEYRVRPESASASNSKMIRGNLRVYEKALAALGNGPDAGIAHRMIAVNHNQLAFEQALTRVEQGDTQGLPALRAVYRAQGGMIWTLAFALWRIAPALAPPMLRWRRRAHMRGGSTVNVPPLPSARPARLARA